MPSRIILEKVPAASEGFLAHVLADHKEKKNLDAGVVIPRGSRIRCRGDVLTNQTLVQELLKSSMRTEEILKWVTLLHLIQCRSATHTIIDQLIFSPLQCTRDVVLAVADFLAERFSKNELLWDTKQGCKGGVWAIRLLAEHWSAVEKYCTALSKLHPRHWTIQKQHLLLAKDIPVLGNDAKSLRFHQFRTVSVLAQEFSGASFPIVTERDWKLMTSSLPGSKGPVKRYHLNGIGEVRAAIAFINHGVGETGYPPFDAYDLSMALCLLPNKHLKYHKCTFLPFAVRSPPNDGARSLTQHVASARASRKRSRSEIESTCARVVENPATVAKPAHASCVGKFAAPQT